MIIDVFLWALVISILAKRFKHVIERKYRDLYLFPVPFAVQILFGDSWILMGLSFAVLVYLAHRNRHIPGFKLIAIGLILNGLEMTLNGGKMPVLSSLAESMGISGDSRHFFTDWSWKLILGDWIPVVLPYGRKFIISIGDVFVYIGTFVFFLRK